jgi:alkyl sulfatase BDS1-like metallo-beta-lactamase superfamily hydrolase
MMGGSEKIMTKAKELNQQGRYRYAVEILNKLVYAEPENQAAKDLLADAYEQLGYQYESPSPPNSSLSGAKELHDGIVPVKAAKAGSPDFGMQHHRLLVDADHRCPLAKRFFIQP